MSLESPQAVRLKPSAARVPELAGGDWLCAWCRVRVAKDENCFQVNGQHEFTFTNPQGIRFDILTFSTTESCDKTGTPTSEHTWFPGHAWSYCQCSECGQHLGWFFEGEHTFAGLIRDRLIRGAHARN